MPTQISTIEISAEEWRHKVATEDDEWVIRQFYGLSLLHKSMDEEVSRLFKQLDNQDDIEHDDMYYSIVHSLEDEALDVDVQLADIEDELDKREICLMNIEED